MTISIGSRLGSYQITSFIGEGGMGRVFRAHDTNLKRDVAIKTLPEELSSDADRVLRFQREAETLASLNHSNIAAIHGVIEAEGSRFLVLELVEGESLEERIARGPIPCGEAIDIARQIAEALEAAHERGIVHRDLKPANIKIAPDGKVKVLDFGLAKVWESGPSAVVSNSPTLLGATTPGMIMGTASYMSPEQARGKSVDRAADIWAFACVLYEMLTGRKTFDGETVTDILGAIVKSEPDWNVLPKDVPSHVRRLLYRCLQKDRRHRLRDAGAVLLELQETLESAGRVATSRRERWAWAGVSAALALTSVFAILVALRPSPTPPEMRLEITTPSTPAPLEFALSPDGRYIVFVASGDGPQRLWLRALDKAEAQPLAGTEGADFPFWSPDSRSIGFTAAGKLKRIDIAGGSPQTLANSFLNRTGAWNTDGTILFNASLGPLSRISASGGEPVAVTRLDSPRHTDHRFPYFLPDGRHFLFYVLGTPDSAGIYLGLLDGGEPKRLASADSAAVYIVPEMIAFMRGTTLMVQHLDLNGGELTGDPIVLADPVGSTGFGYGAFSVSADGRVAYRSGGGALRQLKWYDRAGKALGIAGAPDSNTLLYPELSPDGRRLAVQRNVQNNVDAWLMDLVRGGLTRFTFDPVFDVGPIWSPDGTQIAFVSTRKGSYNIYLRPSNAARAEELLFETSNSKYTQDWSKDGQFLLYGEVDPKTGRDLWALPIPRSDKKPILVVSTQFDELNGQFSPNGRWVAYETNESGRFEIVVQAFPEPSGKWQVSTGGGTQARWRADGSELYFIAPDGKLMAATIAPSAATFAAETPIALFPASLAPSGGANRQQYTVSRDGRFLLNQSVETSSATPITLILNWKPKE